jgi:plasmid segregation protein ParM
MGVVMIVAIDDGYAQTKLAWYKGDKIHTFNIPSQAKASVYGLTTISGALIHAYETSGQKFTVGPHIDCESTQFSEYPFSPLNRAIVTHAIIASGVLEEAEGALDVGVTLPLAVYYQQPRDRERKCKSLRDGVRCISDPSLRLPEYGSCQVFPESAVAWIDAYVDDEGRPIYPLEEVGTTAIIDIGGRTTDIAVFPCQGVVDQEKSGTTHVGVSTVGEQIANELVHRFEAITSEVAGSFVQRALKNGRILLFGKEIDVQNIVSEAKYRVLEEIWRFVERKVGNMARMENIIIVGGGADVFCEQICAKGVPQVRILPEPPFAQVRGVVKYMLFVQ